MTDRSVRRALAAIALIIFWPFHPHRAPRAHTRPPHHTWAAVQRAENTACTTNPCTITVSSTGSGHLGIVVIFDYTHHTVISSVSGGGTWVHPTGSSSCNEYANSSDVDCAYTLSTTSGATSITLSFGTTPGPYAAAEYGEWSYTASPASFDAAGVATTSSNTNPQTAVALTLTGSNDLIVQFLSGTWAATAISSPYTSQANFTNGYGFAGAINTTSGSAPSWTMNNTGAGVVMGAIAFTESGCKPELALLGIGKC